MSGTLGAEQGWDTVVSSCGHVVGMAGWELGVHGCYGTQRDLKLSIASPRKDPSGFSLISRCKITPEPSSGRDLHPLKFPDMRFQVKNQGGAVLGTEQEPPGQVPRRSRVESPCPRQLGFAFCVCISVSSV